MSFQLVPKSVTLNDLEWPLHCVISLNLQKAICGGIYARVYCILVRVQCLCKENSRSLSHLLMSFLLALAHRLQNFRVVLNLFFVRA